MKITIRNLRRNRLYSAINITGLAVSLAACTFIVLWIQDELSYDRFHEDAGDIYMTVAHFRSDAGSSSVRLSAGLFGPVAAQDFSDVESYCRLREIGAGYLQAGGVRTGMKPILLSDSSFFTFFNFPLVRGEKSDILRNPDDVVISESLAHEIFGNGDPVGRTVNLEGWKDLHVAGVMKDMPRNTSVPRAEMICRYRALDGTTDWVRQFYLDAINGWQGCEYLTYLRLKPGTDVKQLAENVTGKQTMMRDIRSFTLQPLVNLYLYTLDGEPAGIKTVRIFRWIAMVILCIACVNYVNLVTARSSKRHREIGLRKVIGARKLRLFGQLIAEAVALFVIAVIIAALLNMLLLPAYNQLAGKAIVLNWLDPGVWLIYGGMLLLVTLLAGMYPSWMLASFRPLSMIQGLNVKRGSVVFRRVLVVLQFVSSAALIVGTIALKAQMNYIRQKDLGFDREQVFTCRLHDMAAHFDAIRSELVQQDAIVGITYGSENITQVTSGTMFGAWEGKTGDGQVSLAQERADTSFLRVMDIPLAEGTGITSTDEPQFILNEAAIRAMGMEDPVGKRVEGIRIVGVARDFHFKSLHQEITPMVIYYQPAEGRHTLYVRTAGGKAQQAIAAVESIWNKYNTSYSFDYVFLDETFDRQYREDVRTGLLFGIFSIIAVFLSCLGLLGLITYTAETKFKEIGIRKVLGAGVIDIVMMLSREFLVLVGIALLIAFPLAYCWLDGMLQDFAYRISLGWWMFAAAAAVTVLLTLLTVSIQAVKAATANPVKSLKTE
ncbi:MAG: ABC transporter permease [Bacteroidales bacterium]|nr:ABC transporter permease [Bacteroidales bacterium]